MLMSGSELVFALHAGFVLDSSEARFIYIEHFLWVAFSLVKLLFPKTWILASETDS
jgi:hypothetical protein